MRPPLLDLTNRLADKIPSLRNVDVAKGIVSLLTGTLLRAYQTGARAAQRANQERQGVRPQELSRLAEASRERAIARDRSNRQLLTNIHELYNIRQPLRRFVDSLRRYPNAVLREAERTQLKCIATPKPLLHSSHSGETSARRLPSACGIKRQEVGDQHMRPKRPQCPLRRGV